MSRVRISLVPSGGVKILQGEVGNIPRKRIVAQIVNFIIQIQMKIKDANSNT
jgi:hypothetical protein